MKLFNYLYIAVLASLGTACADLGTEPLGGTITQDQLSSVQEKDPTKFVSTMSALPANLIAVRNTGVYGHIDFGFPSIAMIFDAGGQDMVAPSSGYNWYRRAMDYTDRTIISSDPAYVWEVLYAEIKLANDVLAVAKKDAADSKVLEYRGAALAFRSWAYLNLIQAFQFTYIGHEEAPGVPILTEETSAEQASNNPRAKVKDVYALIVNDLTEAIELLPETSSTKDQMNKKIAYGLRARAYLVMNKWKEAAADAENAMAGYTPYSIAQVSKPSFYSSADASWMWACVITETNDCVQTGIINFPSQMSSFGGNGYAPSYAGRSASSKLYEQIPETDVRKHWWAVGDSIFSDKDENNDGKPDFSGFNFDNGKNPQVDWSWGYPYKGDVYNIADWAGWGDQYINTKFGAYKGEYNNSTNASDFPLMRVEEMYLIKAEAEAMGGDLAKGKQTLEAFVKTYRDPEFTSKATNAKEFQDEVWLQRRMELWGEGFALFDIHRLKKPIERKGTNYPPSCQYNLPAESQILLFLIPETEMNQNKGIGENGNNPSAEVPKP